MISKNSRSGKQRNFMGHHENLGTLPKYNYSNGAGWRSHNRGNGRMETTVIRRKVSGMTQKQNIGNV